ncbi:MAG: hypothetical protein A2136_06900 [Chloroflexi bacterium RBG_16_54_11]|nr:MAG: hypothetical protein A2136_06900 [Chloroflexi bacterium RBG_16_54_11]
MVDPPGIQNPVLTAEDVTDRHARSVADPFLYNETGQWYMFMEVYARQAEQGDIGLARSTDGLTWIYERIVLDEPFHLSYPYVFKYGNDYYMLPETYEKQEVRLYKSHNFPYDWKYFKTLIKGRDFVDPSIIFFDGQWWIFVGSSDRATLYLYYSDSPAGNWVEHPQSPLIRNDTSQARPGGRFFVYNRNQVIRIAQGWGNGIRIRAFRVYILNTVQY